jgi:hypothetical protein
MLSQGIVGGLSADAREKAPHEQGNLILIGNNKVRENGEEGGESVLAVPLAA